MKVTIKMKGQQEYLAAIDLDYFAVYSKEADMSIRHLPSCPDLPDERVFHRPVLPCLHPSHPQAH